MKPNIIFILSDDQGAWSLGCGGNQDIITPNLDRLALRGLRCTNFFCTSPVCSPARASLLTGKIPSQHGVHDWIREGNSGEKGIEYIRGYSTFSDILSENGYHCGISGKWHLGNSQIPQQGFDHWYVHQKGGGPYHNAPMIKDGKDYKETTYITEAITDDALSFIDSCCTENNPFLSCIHYTAPHSPWVGQHPKRYTDLYKDCEFNCIPNLPRHPWDFIGDAPDGIPKNIYDNTKENLIGYFASITAMDEQIGRIIAQLESHDILENTLICFLSDNGFNCGHHGFWGKGNGTVPVNMFDTSVKVPAIFSHPSHIPQGKISSALISGYDVYPTLLEYAGIPAPRDENFPGNSFNHILRDKEGLSREFIHIYSEYGSTRMIRSKEWKYIHRYPEGPDELYDLVNDPDEYSNLIEEPSLNPLINSLYNELMKWFDSYVDPKVDGLKEPVTGRGQIALCGEHEDGSVAFK